MTAVVEGGPTSDGTSHPSGDERFELIDKQLKRARYRQDQLIETLHVAQDVFGHLEHDILAYVARGLRLPPSMVYGVATFYQLFTFDAPGDHACTVCTGTACFVKGSDAIVNRIEADLGVAAGTTAADGSLTVRTARCIGSCGLAPVVVVDGHVIGELGPAEVIVHIRTALEPVGAGG